MRRYLTILLFFYLSPPIAWAQDYKKDVIDIQIACGFAGVTSTSVNNISQFVAGKAYSFLKAKLFSQNKSEALLSCIAVKELQARALIHLTSTQLKQINTITNWDCNYSVCHTCTEHFAGSVNELLTKENRPYQLIKSAIFKSNDILETPVKKQN